MFLIINNLYLKYYYYHIISNNYLEYVIRIILNKDQSFWLSVIREERLDILQETSKYIKLSNPSLLHEALLKKNKAIIRSLIENHNCIIDKQCILIILFTRSNYEFICEKSYIDLELDLVSYKDILYLISKIKSESKYEYSYNLSDIMKVISSISDDLLWLIVIESGKLELLKISSELIKLDKLIFIREAICHSNGNQIINILNKYHKCTLPEEFILHKLEDDKPIVNTFNSEKTIIKIDFLKEIRSNNISLKKTSKNIIETSKISNHFIDIINLRREKIHKNDD